MTTIKYEAVEHLREFYDIQKKELLEDKMLHARLKILIAAEMRHHRKHVDYVMRSQFELFKAEIQDEINTLFSSYYDKLKAEEAGHE